MSSSVKAYEIASVQGTAQDYEATRESGSSPNILTFTLTLRAPVEGAQVIEVTFRPSNSIDKSTKAYGPKQGSARFHFAFCLSGENLIRLSELVQLLDSSSAHRCILFDKNRLDDLYTLEVKSPK
jgi:hypothetical protein